MATNCSRIKEDPLLPSTQLRNLKPKLRNKLIQILNIGNGWQELALVIPKPNGDGSSLFSASDICVLEQQWKYGTSPAQALLEHWSTMGEKQPTLQDLVNLLREAKLLRAANYISSDLLKVPLVPAEDRNISSEEFATLLKRATGDRTSELCTTGTLIPNEILDDDIAMVQLYSDCENQEWEGLIVYQYRTLEIITQQFSNVPVCHGGCKLGEGAFGTVYRGHIKGQWLAVKKLKESVDSQFETELKVLTRYRHENLLSLLGYSNDGPHWCLVYAYMANGSLQERLACVENIAAIHWITRIKIACGTAQGINHLHTFGDEPLVHRDIKSANVLLDEKLIPKVGDFGLARIGNSNATSTVLVTKNIYGTSVYMAREAFRGDVSAKLDTFSFGVVLMELLTGLPPFDDSREEKDLVSYMEEKCNNILIMLDPKAGIWDQSIAIALYEIAKLCIEERKRNRPTVTQIIPKLEVLLHQCEHNASG